MIPVFYHPDYFAPIGESHTMPMRKFGLVAERLRSDPSALFHEPAPVTIEQLLRVHTPEYIRAIETGEPRALAEEQKFPWSDKLFPAVRLTNGGLVAAAHKALDTGVAAALASGFHHSHGDHGEGFCTFNGLIIALDDLFATGRIRHGAVLDMDLHYGNGTASLAAGRQHITALSIYGNDYWQNKPYRDVDTVRHSDGENHFCATLPNGCGREQMLDILHANLPKLLSRGKPDIILYQAGADPYMEDPYSPLLLDHEALMERDLAVFRFCKEQGIPVAWVLAGGYTKDTSKVVQVHVNTFSACKTVYE
ncbi:MAG: histone deacetylase [Opitutales bacterium]|nr:histone deacetylase [Opitutales bacterium]